MFLKCFLKRNLTISVYQTKINFYNGRFDLLYFSKDGIFKITQEIENNHEKISYFIDSLSDEQVIWQKCFQLNSD